MTDYDSSITQITKLHSSNAKFFITRDRNIMLINVIEMNDKRVRLRHSLMFKNINDDKPYITVSLYEVYMHLDTYELIDVRVTTEKDEEVRILMRL